MKFIRLNITVEGQTEERFVKDTLAPHLGNFNISTDVRRVLTSKDKRKSFRGGLANYQKAKRDILFWLKEDAHSEARFTTMFDLYALPNNFPSYKAAQNIKNPYEKVAFLEKAMEADINDKRFVAYIQLHEFESLVLCKPQNLGYEYFEHEDAVHILQKVLEKYGNNAELINEKIETAPSKRIENLIPEYVKVSVGATLAALEGIDFLKSNCLHFKDWLEKLEKLSKEK